MQRSHVNGICAVLDNRVGAHKLFFFCYITWTYQGTKPMRAWSGLNIKMLVKIAPFADGRDGNL